MAITEKFRKSVKDFGSKLERKRRLLVLGIALLALGVASLACVQSGSGGGGGGTTSTPEPPKPAPAVQTVEADVCNAIFSDLCNVLDGMGK